MTRKSLLHQSAYLIQANGQYRLASSGTSITVKWNAEGMTPAGLLTFSVDGDPGEGVGVIDLSASGEAGSRTLKTTGYVFPFLDIDVSGLPEGGSFILYIN